MKHKWNITNSKIFVSFDICLISIILPIILTGITDISLFYLLTTSLLYALVLNCALVILFILKSKKSLSRILYELRMSGKLYYFMLSCYHDSAYEHKKFLIDHNLLNKGETTYNYDVIVMSQVFRTIFSLYFKNMEEKEKSSEPYLIDSIEMQNLYNNQHFEEFYTKIFFGPTKNNKQYVYLLIYILDHVLEDLYKKSWFVSYYDEYILFNFINFLLKEWYEQIIAYNISKIKVYNPVLA